MYVYIYIYIYIYICSKVSTEFCYVCVCFGVRRLLELLPLLQLRAFQTVLQKAHLSPSCWGPNFFLFHVCTYTTPPVRSTASPSCG